MPFVNHAELILVDEHKDIWELAEALHYVTAEGVELTVPAGFVCDLASVPRLPLTWFLFKGSDTHRPGILHDYLCRAGAVSRRQADQIFYEALRDEGLGVVRARLMWLAVRAYSATK